MSMPSSRCLLGLKFRKVGELGCMRARSMLTLKSTNPIPLPIPLALSRTRRTFSISPHSWKKRRTSSSLAPITSMQIQGAVSFQTVCTCQSRRIYLVYRKTGSRRTRIFGCHEFYYFQRGLFALYFHWYSYRYVIRPVSFKMVDELLSLIFPRRTGKPRMRQRVKSIATTITAKVSHAWDLYAGIFSLKNYIGVARIPFCMERLRCKGGALGKLGVCLTKWPGCESEWIICI